MPKVFTSEKQKIGEVGENIATRFLVKHGFKIIERNYTRKWGEIDIIAEKSDRLYFVEVKSISSTDANVSVSKSESMNNVSQGTWRPEDNMHPWKLKRISRALQTYLMSNKKFLDLEWQVDLLVVYLDIKNKKAKVKVVNDIIL